MTTPKTTARRHPLQALRIARDWSYAQLASEIQRVTGLVRTQAAWRAICRGEAVARDTTQDAIDQFLASQGGSSKRQAVSR